MEPGPSADPAGNSPGERRTTTTPSLPSHRALELGVNWIDTAAAYGLGHSEEIVAKALKSWSGPKPYVFTKCGLRWDDQGNVIKTSKLVPSAKK